jgi:Cu(I)/Ag(I) efflux system periplasmic protein CusF
MRRLPIALALAALSLGGSVVAHATNHATHALTDGEVRKVDKDSKKITIRHGPIKNLEMPPMTMVFQVTDPAMLEQVKAGDKIRFSAEKPGGTYTVTQIQPVQ